MWGSTALVIRIRPKTLMSKTSLAWLIELSSPAPTAPTPALLTRTSIRPNRSITSSTRERTDSSPATSRSRNVTPASGSAFAALRLVPTTAKPASARASAAARPIPEEAPVTRATGGAVCMVVPSVVVMTLSCPVRGRQDGCVLNCQKPRRFCTELSSTGGRLYRLCMARPRSFDRDHVLHAAERQFRTTGYNGTSVDDISAATGLGRGSLYAAFDGKHGVLLQAMVGYYARLGQFAPKALAGPDEEALERLHQYLLRAVHGVPLAGDVPPAPDRAAATCFAARMALEIGAS